MTTSPGKVESLDGVLRVDEAAWRAARSRLTFAAGVTDELEPMREVVAEIVYRVMVTVEVGVEVDEGTTVLEICETVVVVDVVVNAVVAAVETMVSVVESVWVVRVVE